MHRKELKRVTKYGFLRVVEIYQIAIMITAYRLTQTRHLICDLVSVLLYRSFIISLNKFSTKLEFYKHKTTPLRAILSLKQVPRYSVKQNSSSLRLLVLGSALYQKKKKKKKVVS